MEPDPAQCLAALSEALGLEPARLRLRLEIPTSARRPEYTALRHAVEVDGRPRYSVKWYPPGYHRSVDDIVQTSRRLSDDLGLRIPAIVTRIRCDAAEGVVEEYIDAPSLQIMRERGQIDEAGVVRILTDVFEHCMSHPYAVEGQRERDRQRCLDAIRWLGDGTPLHRDLVHLIQSSDTLFTSSAFLVQEDLVAANILMVDGREPVLIDHDHCRLTTIPWFGAWRASHAGRLPRFFWREAWDKPGLPLLFSLCGALEAQLQFSVLDPARFVSDRDQNWEAQLAAARESLEVARARAEAHAAAIESLSASAGQWVEEARRAAREARDDLSARLLAIETGSRAAFADLAGALSRLGTSVGAISATLDQTRASLTEGQATIRALAAEVSRDSRLTARLLGTALPSVSIVIVHYNGRRFLPGLFRSLARLDYPNVEIVFVDNASTDGSADLAASLCPHAVIVRSPENLGFAGGNNLGVRHAAGDYVVFLNNDTEPDPHWLTALVTTARSSPRVGAVGSKILFFTKFIQVTLAVPRFTPTAAPGVPSDDRELGVAVDTESAVSGSDYRKPLFVDGFFGEERWGTRTVRWSRPAARLLLPVNVGETSATLRLICAGGAAGEPRPLRVTIGAQTHELAVAGDFQTFELTLGPDVLGGAVDVINNAGSVLDAAGNAGDRGINCIDDGTFDREENLSCLCGCSLLMPRWLFERLGGFDASFFMYFEDTDLCWRIRRAGFTLRYQPRSVVRHLHAASSTEWSPFFTFFVIRNGRVMRLKHLPLPQARAEYRILVRQLAEARARLDGPPPVFARERLNGFSPAQIEFLALSQAQARGRRVLARRSLLRLLRQKEQPNLVGQAKSPSPSGR